MVDAQIIPKEQVREFVFQRMDYNIIAEMLKRGNALIIKTKPQNLSKIKRSIEKRLGERVIHALIGVDESNLKQKIYVILRESDWYEIYGQKK